MPETLTRTVLITGANGSVGQALGACLTAEGRGSLYCTDIDSLDVRDRFGCQRAIRDLKPDLIYHLAGAKHAPEGEVNPISVARTNIEGTANVLAAASAIGAKVVLASTCKAADPETVYGASKLIAERMTLNARQIVARFYNIRESSGNVFRIWESISEHEPLPVTPGRRYWTSMEQAIQLLLACAEFPCGRYTIHPRLAEWIVDTAAALYPGRELRAVPLRRGDRPLEPLCASGEYMWEWTPGFMRITSPYDGEGR